LANLVTYENWIDVHGTILDGPRENSAFEIEGESDLSIARSGSFGLTPDIPMPNPKYLEDVNSMRPPRSAKPLESLNNKSPWPIGSEVREGATQLSTLNSQLSS
jgi:hypothetical protein